MPTDDEFQDRADTMRRPQIESRAQRPSYLVEMTFTEALILARAAFDAAESIKLHPLKDTHTNDVPVVAAKLVARVYNEKAGDLEADNARLKQKIAEFIDGEKAYPDGV